MTEEDPCKTDNSVLKKYRHAEEALRESEARYRSLFENSPTSLWEEDFSAVKIQIDNLKASGIEDFRVYFDDHLEEISNFASLVKILDINKATIELLEAKNKEEVFVGLPKIFTDESLEIFKEELIALSEGKRTFESEAPHLTLKGNVKKVMIKLTLIPEYAKTWSKLFISITDITELKNIEDDLKLSQSNLETLFNSIYDYIFVLDIHGNILRVNQKVVEQVGYSEDILLNMHVLDLHAPDRRKEAEKIVADMMTGKSNSCNIPIQTKDGKLIPVETKISKGFWGNQEVLFGISREITERIKAEENLRKSEEKYRHLFENAPSSILLIDSKGIIRDINPRIIELTGYNREELIGRNYLELSDLGEPLAEKYLPRLMKRLDKLVHGQKLPPIELKIKAKDGKVLWFNFLTNVIKIGEEIFLQTIGHDITEEREIQDTLIKTSNRANFYKDLFAHDMRNILTAISSSADLYSLYREKSVNIKETDNLMNIIRDQTNRGTHLISNVQKLSKIEESKISIEKKDVNAILNDAIEFVLSSYNNLDIKISISAKEAKYYAMANELLLDVFENLLINSVKHNDNPKIEIQLKISKEKKQKKKYLKIEFIDNGRGNPEARKETIFQRVSNQERSTSGMGLGLSLVKFIIDSYNGDILVKDRNRGNYTKGSNFIVLIPEAN